ncbi:MAG: helix-hairpin-helix domain-containing protein [Paludibacteraceae bacterium]|nr:helix-hairpin-helix domain-containing protein [Paludibacteraceae bacterium]
MSKKQWIGFAILVLLVTAVELCVRLTDRWLDRQPKDELLVFQPEREEAFQHYLDSLSEAEYATRQARYAARYPKQVIRLRPFDPNTADSTLLVTVGLKPWMAHNLIRYRQAGKVFRQKDELRRLYGMTDSLYATLAPYIQIDTLANDTVSRFHQGLIGGMLGSNADSSLFSCHSKRDTVLDLNTADTAELQLLRGIGRYTAVQIVRYRQALGGYYSPNQLYEISQYYNLPHFPSAERIDSLLPHLFADTTLITPIHVNRASVKQLQRHPYISYPQAQQLYDLRRRKLRLSSLDDLSAIFNPDERRRLAPYLRFTAQD